MQRLSAERRLQEREMTRKRFIYRRFLVISIAHYQYSIILEGARALRPLMPYKVCVKLFQPFAAIVFKPIGDGLFKSVMEWITAIFQFLSAYIRGYLQLTHSCRAYPHRTANAFCSCGGRIKLVRCVPMKPVPPIINKF